MQSNATCKYELATQLNHLASLARWLSARLQTKWLLARIQLQSLEDSDEEKYVSSGYGISSDSAGSWSFDNDSAGNVRIIVVDNSLSCYA